MPESNHNEKTQIGDSRSVLNPEDVRLSIDSVTDAPAEIGRYRVGVAALEPYGWPKISN